MLRLGGLQSCITHSHHGVECLRILFLLSNVASQGCRTGLWSVWTADGGQTRCGVQIVFPIQQLLSLSVMPCKEFIPNRAWRRARWEALAQNPLSVKDAHIRGVLVLLFYWAEECTTPDAFVCEAPEIMMEGSFRDESDLVIRPTC